MLKKTLFNSVIYKGTLGSVYGIVAGLLLGLLIWTLLQVAMALNSSILYQGVMDARTSGYMGPPFEFLIMMGMGFGAIIGGIFGALTALKEGKK